MVHLSFINLAIFLILSLSSINPGTIVVLTSKEIPFFLQVITDSFTLSITFLIFRVSPIVLPYISGSKGAFTSKAT